ncbi:NrsF family protein [Pararhodobacter sp. CCB-MM2]|uniref:NrsF family protein n=1 Tax=Pararhodobacter sp. CCB-MM2 TaxID=1786003 RepID=UPI00082CA0E7|nr:DUF1109 domain-containing protein [Pararhodobacter sp. CCB-MM2]
MKTEDFIAALAADTTPSVAPGVRMLRSLPLALALSFAAFLLFWHTRPDLAEALTSPALYKTALPLALSLAALWLVRGMSRPEARLGAQGALLAVLLAGMAGLLAYALAVTTMPETRAILDTPDYTNCLISVPALASLPLGAALWSLKAGAPRHPGWAGAAAGLTAGGEAAAIYSLHCPHDALMYFFPAYGVAMAVVTLIGAVIGARFLRW